MVWIHGGDHQDGSGGDIFYDGNALARGQFHKAIMESPADKIQWMLLRHPFLSYPAGEEFGQQFAERFVPAGDGQVAALRQVPAGHLYELIREEDEFQRFYPIIDGYVLEKSLFEAFLDGDRAQVPTLLGSNADEGNLFFPLIHSPIFDYEDVQAHEVAGLIRNVFGDEAEAIMDLYPDLRQGKESAQIDFMSDNLFGAAVHFYAMCAAKAGQPVYLLAISGYPPLVVFCFREAPVLLTNNGKPVLPLRPDPRFLDRRAWGSFTI
jgi:carboxylesterase type B